MEDSIKLLIFDFINFISFLKKQPNVPKSWLSRIKRLEHKCDQLGLTSKSAPENPPEIILPSSGTDVEEEPLKLSVKCEINYLSDNDDLLAFGPAKKTNNCRNLGSPNHVGSELSDKRSLKPEECDRDMLMEHSIKIGKIYVKNIRNFISSTLGKKVEKGAILTTDFRFVLYKTSKTKIDTVLDIRKAHIQSNKLKNKRFTITASTEKSETMEFEATDEAERDSWVYALYNASRGINIKTASSVKCGENESIYQQVQEVENYNSIDDEYEDDIDDDYCLESNKDDTDSPIYKFPKNNRPVECGDYPLMSDDSDEDFEDDENFEDDEIDLLPLPTPPPPESQYEFEDSSSYTSNSSLSLCSPLPMSAIIEEREEDECSTVPPKPPAKNCFPSRPPENLPPKQKPIRKPAAPTPSPDIEDDIIPNEPPVLPPKNRNVYQKMQMETSKTLPPKKTQSLEESRLNNSMTQSDTEAKSLKGSSSLNCEGQRNSILSSTSVETNDSSSSSSKSRHPSSEKSKKVIEELKVEENESSNKGKSMLKRKISLSKKLFKNSTTSRTYVVNPPTTPPTDERNQRPPQTRQVSMQDIKTELVEKIELRNKRLKLKKERNVIDIGSNATLHSNSPNLELLGKKPSEVKAITGGCKPQILKPKPTLANNVVLGKIFPPQSRLPEEVSPAPVKESNLINPQTQIEPDSPRTAYNRRKKLEHMTESIFHQRFSELSQAKGSSTDEDSLDNLDDEDDWSD